MSDFVTSAERNGTTLLVPLPIRLPAHHPFAARKAWQCDACNGIFFPEAETPTECPYCADDDE